MIIKINKIKDFGIFRNFTWPTTGMPDFQKHNLLYGWNYSWKTTISRVFRSFEKGQKHLDYPDATFSLYDGTRSHTEADLTTLPNVRVFNIDFINENLKWYSNNENQIEPIFILGEENIELQERLETLKREWLWFCQEKERTDLKHTETKDKIESDLTEWANRTKTSLNLMTYMKTHLRSDISEVQANPSNFILPQEEVARLLSAVLSAEQKDAISEIAISGPSFRQLIETTTEIIRRTITSRPILELQENPDLNTWVDTWRGLHLWKDVCQFCGWTINDDLFQKLDEHFSTEYSRLKQDIASMKAKLSEYKRQLETKCLALPAKEKAYPEFQEGFEVALTDLRSEVLNLIGGLSSMEAVLIDRENNPFTPNTNTLEIDDNSAVVGEKLRILNGVISQHNHKKTNFDTDKTSKTTSLKQHYAAKEITDGRYSEREVEKTELATKSEELKRKITTKKDEIDGVEAQLSNSARWAWKINEYIQQFFQHDGLSVGVWPSSRFEILREWELAKNLSEWEKTAISLAYFMTRLDALEIDLADCIVFLDDPISSLDWNHLFNTYAFIKAKLESCKQLFVSTHNLDFFNLMKDFIEKIEVINPRHPERMMRLYPSEKLPYYLVQRRKWAGWFHSSIQDMPKSMKRHRTEYIYLFSILIEHKAIEETISHDMLYMLPNILRRFLEWYSAQRLPWKDWKIILEMIVENEIDRHKTIRFLNTYSHNQTSETAIRFPEVSECRDIINLVLNWMELQDQKHFGALVGCSL